MKKFVLSIIALLFCMSSFAVAQTEHAMQVKDAIDTMIIRAERLGEPIKQGDNLFFGPTLINGRYELVDMIKAKFNCTATFFVAKDDGYIRISTNVIKPDGSRAIGTVLDPQGPVIGKIRKGESFYGIVDILGRKYDTGYEPIKDASGAVIGIYYVGFLLE